MGTLIFPPSIVNYIKNQIPLIDQEYDYYSTVYLIGVGGGIKNKPM